MVDFDARAILRAALAILTIPTIACGQAAHSSAPKIRAQVPAPLTIVEAASPRNPGARTDAEEDARYDAPDEVNRVTGAWDISLKESEDPLAKPFDPDGVTTSAFERPRVQVCDDAIAKDEKFIPWLNENRIALSCEGDQLPPEGASVERVHLRRINDKLLSARSAFPKLRELTIRGSTLSGTLSMLQGLPSLRELSFVDTEATRANLDFVFTLKSLRSIAFTDVTGVGDRMFLLARSMPNLRVLGLRRAAITDAGLAQLGSLSQLRSLDLHGTRITNAGVASLSQLHDLRVLNLSGTFVSDEGLAHLKALPHLRVLSLGGTYVSDKGLAHLRALSELRVLDLQSTSITDVGLAHLSQLRELRSLDLTASQVSDGVATSVVSLQRLERLMLGFTGVTDASMPTLARLPLLRQLDLRETTVTAKGLSSIEALPKLHNLDLDHVKLSTSDVLSLTKFAPLRTVRVDAFTGATQANGKRADLRFVSSFWSPSISVLDYARQAALRLAFQCTLDERANEEVWIVAQLQSANWRSICMQQQVESELVNIIDTSSPPERAALIEEQRLWTQLIDSIVAISEDYAIADRSTGYRYTNSVPGNYGWDYPYSRATGAVHRLTLLRAARGSMTTREAASYVDMKLSSGLETVIRVARRFKKKPPPPPPDEEGPVTSYIAPWDEMEKLALSINSLSKQLAHLTCGSTFPALSKELGGKRKCESVLSNYYASHALAATQEGSSLLQLPP